MARKKQSYIKGTFTHRRSETDYMGVLLDAVSLDDWRSVVATTVAAAEWIRQGCPADWPTGAGATGREGP